jgi:hypothetical protein
MTLSWIGRNRSLAVSPQARLVADSESDALRRKLESLQWRPQNGFLKDEPLADQGLRESRAA